jgi:hypothetical protein
LNARSRPLTSAKISARPHSAKTPHARRTTHLMMEAQNWKLETGKEYPEHLRATSF